MACRYTYKGKTYEAWEFEDVLKAMSPAEASDFMPSVRPAPDAPFVTKTDGWLNLVLKRVIAMAVDGGYDAVAFITGQQSSDRYDLSKRVESISAYKVDDGYKIIAHTKNGGTMPAHNAKDEAGIADLVGKELAAKIVQDLNAPGMGDRAMNTYSGLDLKVGGSGMVKFYDSIVPSASKALLKKVGGGQMRDVSITTPRGKPTDYADFNAWKNTPQEVESKQPGFDITDAMREKVSTEGLPLFSSKRDVTETPEFKAWFGDSKVVDADGKPLTVYHGTLADITAFDPSHAAEPNRALGDSPFSWFAGTGFVNEFINKAILPARLFDTHPEYGSTGQLELGAKHRRIWNKDKRDYEWDFRGPSMYPAFLSIENPLDLRPFGESMSKPSRDAVNAIAAAAGVDSEHLWRRVREALDSEEYGSVWDDDEDTRAATIVGLLQEPDVSSGLMEAGIVDGIISNEAGEVVYATFRPEQIKSAIGNRGAFDPLSGDITKSSGRTATGADWDSPSAAKFDDMVYKLQDKHIDTKRVVEAIQAAGSAIKDDLNVYLQEELYHGRAAKRTEDFVNMELNPLVEQLAKDGLKLEDLEEFLHARHAPEANKVIAARNPGNQGLQDGGSGMMTAEALNYMATLPADMRQKLEAAAAKVDAIIGKTRQLYVDYELESKSTVDGWGQVFKHYIPLQREDKNGSPGLGQGFSIKGKETKGRTGSTRKVVDILANIALQREKAITRGEKNRVSQALVGLAASNPNEGFWQVDEVPTERVFNPDTGLVEDRVDPLYKSRDNAVIAKIADSTGRVREHAVLFNEEDPRALRMAQSLKNLDAANLEGLLGVSAKVSRYFAAVNTQWNPVFGVVNLVRDVQGALLNLSTTPLAGEQAKIAKYTMSALRGVYGDARAARNGKNPSSQWAALWDEFQEVGGQTGYRELFKTSADRAEAIKDVLNPDAWADSKLGKIFTANGVLKVPMAQAKRGAGFIFDWLSDYNLAMENGVRLAAYKAGIESGMSKEQAASAAKNLTVNFNRKGQVSQQAGAMYAFFNASVQGTARIAQTIFEMEPGKPKTLRLSPMGKKVVYGGMILGSIQALALAAAGFNDDDPPDFARERSLIIPIGGKKYVTIPMPLGFHVLPSIGRVMTEFALSGFKDPHKRALSLASLFADTFNPIGNAGLSMQTLAPTMLDPFVALTENKDYTGKPIARESSNKAIPGHALGRDTATSVAMLLSEAINYASGGNKYTAGVFSPTPDQIDYLIGQVTGGVGRELSKVEQSVLATARGEDLPTYKVPLAGRFFGDAKSQASEGAAFYANSDRLNKLETEIKGLQKDGKSAEASELRRNSSEAYLITAANHAERQIQKLRSEKRELVHSGAPRDQVIAIEEKITGVMARLNRAVEALREKQEN